jgi:pimeloyl-ACP methyl ester carboxylesterase
VSASEAAGARLLEDHFFFEPSAFEQPLYARTHIPVAGQRDLGVLVVPPIGRERQRILREMTNLGRDVAAAGFPVLRFDYRGEGESGGEFSESTVTTRVADTVAAAHELRRRSGAGRVALIGFHIGAVVAALAARDANADLLVCCDPACAIQPYVKNLIRASILQQSQYSGRPPELESEVRARLRAGNVINIYGFLAAAPLIDELETLDVTVALSEFSGSSAIMYFRPKEAPPPPPVHAWGALLGAPSRCAIRPLTMSFSWTTRKRWVPRLGPLNEAVVEWLQTTGQEAPVPLLSAR